MSAPAAKARSEPPRTMQRTSGSRSSSERVPTSSSISSSESAFSCSGRLSRTTAIAPSRSVRTRSATSTGAMSEGQSLGPARNGRGSLLLQKAFDRGLRLVGRHRESKPVAGVVDRLVPGEVAPEVEVLLRVPRRLRKLARQALDDAVDLGVQLAGGHRSVDEPPFFRLARRDLLAHEDDLARAAVADHDREPLRRPAGRDRAVLGPDVPNKGVVDHDREVAGHLQLVSAADADTVDPRQRRLADLAKAVVRVLERAEPLPVLVRLADVALAPLLQVGADAERAPGAGQDDDADGVVPR